MSEHESSTMTLEKVEIAMPDMYNVIIFNDNETHMQFVVELLKKVFRKTDAEAKDITMCIHNDGSAIVGKYVEEIAVMKKEESLKMASARKQPLKVEVEKV